MDLKNSLRLLDVAAVGVYALLLLGLALRDFAVVVSAAVGVSILIVYYLYEVLYVSHGKG